MLSKLTHVANAIREAKDFHNLRRRYRLDDIDFFRDTRNWDIPDVHNYRNEIVEIVSNMENFRNMIVPWAMTLHLPDVLTAAIRCRPRLLFTFSQKVDLIVSWLCMNGSYSEMRTVLEVLADDRKRWPTYYEWHPSSEPIDESRWSRIPQLPESLFLAVLQSPLNTRMEQAQFDQKLGYILTKCPKETTAIVTRLTELLTEGQHEALDAIINKLKELSSTWRAFLHPDQWEGVMRTVCPEWLNVEPFLAISERGVASTGGREEMWKQCYQGLVDAGYRTTYLETFTTSPTTAWYRHEVGARKQLAELDLPPEDLAHVWVLVGLITEVFEGAIKGVNGLLLAEAHRKLDHGTADERKAKATASLVHWFSTYEYWGSAIPENGPYLMRKNCEPFVKEGCIDVTLKFMVQAIPTLLKIGADPKAKLTIPMDITEPVYTGHGHYVPEAHRAVLKRRVTTEESLAVVLARCMDSPHWHSYPDQDEVAVLRHAVKNWVNLSQPATGLWDPWEEH